MKRIFYSKDKNGQKYILLSPLGLPPHKDNHTCRWEADENDAEEAEWYSFDGNIISWFVDVSDIPEPEWEDEEPIELYIKPVKPGYSL